ncbi:MAG: hypothetical protein EP297_00180 [Gammaproteobacteria bacterium]|nr:MAG: hypothetical protein EP297_00180 [Gammaproteobacteria bacterium]
MNYLLIFLLLASSFFTIANAQMSASSAWEEQSTHAEKQTESKPLLLHGNTKIWLDEGVSISKMQRLILFQAVDTADSELPKEILSDITSTIRGNLAKAGLEVVEPGQPLLPDDIAIKLIVTKYEPGSVGGRWLAPGFGVTVSIVRATLFLPANEEVVGKIISWQQVSGGGIFSAGADKYVPQETAEAVAEALIQQIHR